MPFYEYKCKECKKKFETFSRSANHEDKVKCPWCSSEKVDKQFSAFSSTVPMGSDSDTPPPSCSSGCCSCGL